MSEFVGKTEDTYFHGYQETCPIHPPEHQIQGDNGEKLTPLQTLTERDLFLKRMLVDSYAVWRKLPDTNISGMYATDENDDGLYLSNGHEHIQFASKEDGVIAEVDMEIARQCEMVIADPVAAWGRRGSLLLTHTGYEPVYAPHDVPDRIQDTFITADSNIQQAMFDYAKYRYGYGTVSTGNNFGQHCIGGVGLNTMLHFHKQTFIPDSQNNTYTHNLICEVRDAQRWDQGISRTFAENMRDDVDAAISQFSPELRITPDAMGFSIALPGFTPQDYDRRFVEQLLKPMSLTIHEHLRDVYTMMWGHKNGRDLNDVIWYLYNAQFNGFDRKFFDTFYPNITETSVPKAAISSQHADLYSELAALDNVFNGKGTSLLRKAPGWAFLLNYQEEGALITSTFGFLNKNVGPVEGGGVSLNRPKEKLTTDQRQKITDFNKQIVTEACASLIYSQVRL